MRRQDRGPNERCVDRWSEQPGGIEAHRRTAYTPALPTAANPIRDGPPAGSRKTATGWGEGTPVEADRAGAPGIRGRPIADSPQLSPTMVTLQRGAAPLRINRTSRFAPAANDAVRPAHDRGTPDAPTRPAPILNRGQIRSRRLTGQSLSTGGRPPVAGHRTAPPPQQQPGGSRSASQSQAPQPARSKTASRRPRRAGRFPGYTRRQPTTTGPARTRGSSRRGAPRAPRRPAHRADSRHPGRTRCTDTTLLTGGCVAITPARSGPGSPGPTWPWVFGPSRERQRRTSARPTCCAGQTRSEPSQ